MSGSFPSDPGLPEKLPPELAMDDQMLQTLYGTTLKLQAYLQVAGDSPDKVTNELESVIGALSNVIEALRERIYQYTKLDKERGLRCQTTT